MHATSSFDVLQVERSVASVNFLELHPGSVITPIVKDQFSALTGVSTVRVHTAVSFDVLQVERSVASVNFLELHPNSVITPIVKDQFGALIGVSTVRVHTAVSFDVLHVEQSAVCVSGCTCRRRRSGSCGAGRPGRI